MGCDEKKHEGGGEQCVGCASIEIYKNKKEIHTLVQSSIRTEIQQYLKRNNSLYRTAKMRKTVNMFFEMRNPPHSKTRATHFYTTQGRKKEKCLEHGKSDRKGVLLTIYWINLRGPAKYIYFFFFIKSFICSISTWLPGSDPD